MNQSQIMLSFAQPGDVIRIHPRNYVLVVSRDRHSGDHFYFTPCNYDGSLTEKKYEQSAANYISSSVMLSIKDGMNIEIVNQIELRKYTVFHNCAKYEWHLTGDYAIDCYMSHLDERYSLFQAVSSHEERRQYLRDEDRNYHEENATFVAKLASKILVSKLLKLKRAA